MRERIITFVYVLHYWELALSDMLSERKKFDGSESSILTFSHALLRIKSEKKE